jgi:TorA maturation chaperone TorD
MTNTRYAAPMSAQELAELSGARRDLYRFLSAAFLQPPTTTLLGAVCDGSFLDELSDWASDETVVKFRVLGSAADDGDFAEHARRDFMQLFQVPGAQQVTPYESVHRDRRVVRGREVAGLLYGPSTMAVQQWYQLGALEVDPAARELPDHVGVELNFLAYLCEKEGEFARAGDVPKQTRAREMQRDFLKAHVLSWLPGLAAAIEQKAVLPLYPAIALLAVNFCCDQQTILEAQDGPSEGNSLPSYVH